MRSDFRLVQPKSRKIDPPRIDLPWALYLLKHECVREKAARILVVDDDEIFCRLLAEIFEGQGMAVVWTINSLAGYEMSTRDAYDVFVFDVRMPLILGTELAEAVKKDRPNAKIILVSAFADEKLQQFSKNKGIPILSKPFSTNRLLELVESALGDPVGR